MATRKYEVKCCHCECIIQSKELYNEIRKITPEHIYVLCPACAKMLLKPCAVCEIKKMPMLHLFEVSEGIQVCESCLDKHYAHCDCCDGWHKKENLLSIADRFSTIKVCQKCLDSKFTKCSCCDGYFRRQNVYDIDGKIYCETCRRSRYSICHSCGNYVLRQDATDIDGISYCDTCRDDFFLFDSENNTWVRRPRSCTGGFPILKTTTFDRLPSWEWGVELETSACECDDYDEFYEEVGFLVHHDASISGLEFVSPICNGDSGLDLIKTFCDNTKGFKVDKNCGFHLHLNMQNETLASLKNIKYAYLHTAELWACFVPGFRLESSFCKKLKKGDKFIDRYYWFNEEALYKYGTYEIRSHSATLNYDKIVNWITAHVLFVRAVKDMPPAEIDHFFGETVAKQWEAIQVIWPHVLSGFYFERAKRFHNEDKLMRE